MTGWGRRVLIVVSLAGCGGGCRHIAAQPLQSLETATRLETRSLEAPELHDFLAVHLPIAPARWPLEQWGLEELTLAALYFQPSLALARAAATVNHAHVGTVAQRPNPTLSITPQFVSNPASGVSPWLATTQLTWLIETAGKRDERMNAAQARADAADLTIWTEGWAVRTRTYTGIVTLAAARARRRVLVRARDAQAALVDLLEGRLASGAISQAELEPQRIALVRTAAGVAAADRQILAARAGLAAALAVPPAAIDAVEVVFPLAIEPDALDELSAHDARRAALLGRSDVLALLDEYAAAESDLRLELAKQYPNLQIGPNYEFDQGSNKWGFGLGLELPILSQNEGAIDEALARRQQAATHFEALQSSVIAEVAIASAQLEGSRQEWRENRRLVTEATRQRDLAAAALARGAADRVKLLSAELERLTAEVALVDAQERFHLAVAALEHAVQPTRAFTAVTVTPALPAQDA